MRYHRLIVFFFFLASGIYAQNSNELDLNKTYPHQVGNLYFSKGSATFTYIKNTEVWTDTILVFNNWTEPMELRFSGVSDCISVKALPDVLKPKKQGMILITYDAVKRGEVGRSMHGIFVETNDTDTPRKRIHVSAYIEEDFSMLTEEERKNAPVIVFDETTYDFGEAQTGDKVSASYVFRNEGKSDLIIRKTYASCGCTATKPQKSVLKPGEESSIDVVFNTKGRKGMQHKTAFVFCNDPRNHTISLHIQGKVNP